MHSDFQHIFFDLDFTLWDFHSNSTVALEYIVAEDKGIELDAKEFIEVFRRCNEKFWKRYRSGFISAEELKWKRFWHSLIEFGYGDAVLAKRWSRSYLELLGDGSLLCTGAGELLEYLREKGYTLHIITNGFEEVQQNKLRNSGIEHFFATVTCSDAIGISKPSTGIFEHAMKHASATMENSIYVGDSLEADVLGAYKFGWPVIHFAEEPAILDVHYPGYNHVQNLADIQKLL